MGKIYKNGIEYGGGGGQGSGGHTILDTDGTSLAQEDNLQFKGLDVSDNSADETTEVAAFGLNSDSLDDVMSAGAAGNQVASNGLVYSTTEQVVGKWIDGKPLYQKTVAVPIASNSTWNTVNHNISNILEICNIKMVCHRNEQNIATYTTGASSAGNRDAYANSSTVGINTTDSSIVGTTGYVTLQYTKTTD